MDLITLLIAIIVVGAVVYVAVHRLAKEGLGE